MKISPEHRSIITEKLKNLEGKKDLLRLLNITKKFMYGDDCKPVLLKSVTWYANPKLSGNKRYRTFTIPKKSDELREIHAPVAGLKNILRILNVILESATEPHKCATGFVTGKSIVDNAKLHTNKHYVYNTDLKNFFHSFDRNRVKMGLWFELFGMEKEKEPLAFLLASLCTHPIEIDGQTRIVLPQGSPASPVITNILCKKLDRRLNGLAKRFNVRYSRYADDISFSADYNVFSKEEFQSELKRIVCEDQNLDFNPQKTRLQETGYHQEVTGLTVNEKVNVRRTYIKEIRMWLYYWEKYGYKKANQIYQKEIPSEKFRHKWATPQLKNVLDGKLEFLKMVKGSHDSTYNKLIKKYNMLLREEKHFFKASGNTKLDISEFVDESIIEELLKEAESQETNQVHNHIQYSKMVDLIVENGLNAIDKKPK